MMSLEELRQAWKRGGILIALTSATGGFVADVLQPIAPFSEYIFLIALTCTAIALVAYLVVLKPYRPHALTILVCAVIASVVTGGVFALQRATGPEQGCLAELVPGIEQLQCSLGLMHKDVRVIARTAASIQTDTTSILQDTGDIKHVVKKLDMTIEAIGVQAAHNSGIIALPQKPEDHYHNARIYELGGDYGNARKSYEAYVTSAAHHVDAHRRFQAFLKIQEGLAGAREIYRSMLGQQDEPIVRFAMILLEDQEARAADLEAYLADYPDCAPAYYELSLLYSKRVLGAQSVADKRKEKELLSAFLRLLEEGEFYKYYVDKEEADEVVSEAQERFAALETFEPAALENPVSVVPARHTDGWSLTVTVADTTTDISYKLPGQAEFTSTGTTAFVSPATGRPVPRGCFELPALAQAQTIQIKYVDVRGKEHGPFEYHFSPSGSLGGAPIQVLNMTKTSWITIKTEEPNSFIYFTHLLTHRSGLSEIRYGVNTDVPDQTFSFPACDASGAMELDTTGPVFIEYPGRVNYAVVQLVFADGTTSTVEKFK